MADKEIIQIYGSALKEQVGRLEGEGFYDIEWFYDDDTPMGTIADKHLYYVENEIRIRKD